MRVRRLYFDSWQVSGKKRHWGVRAILTLAICLTCTLPSMVCYANSESGEPLYDINIPSTNAAEALNRIAEQTGAVMLFPYDLARFRQANAVVGRYTLFDALERLLKDTGLSSGLSDKRVILISDEESEQRNKEEGDMATANGSSKKKGLAALLASIFAGSLAGAQENNRAPGARALEEIVVVAQKREQSLHDVPISITALSDVTLERAGITRFAELTRLTPNFSFSQVHDSASSARLTIRGISNRQRNAGWEGGIGVYVDGVYAGRQDVTTRLNLQNIERVEVLRGPQGTLFGKNTIAGAINIITKKPGSEREGKATLNIGNLDKRDFNGYVSGPLVEDKVFLGASFYRQDRGGYATNLFDGSELATEDSIGGDLKLRVVASDDLEVYVRGFYNKFDRLILPFESEDGTGLPNYVPTDGLDEIVWAPGIRTVNDDVVPVDVSETYGAAMTIDYQLPNAYTFTSITAYERSDSYHSQDNDASPLPNSSILRWGDISKHATQEFRLASPAEGRFDYVVGAYLFWQNLETERPLGAADGSAFAPAPGTDPDGVSMLNPTTDVETRSAGLYGHANYRLTEKLTLNAGLRYTAEEKEVVDYTMHAEGGWAAIFGFEGFTADLSDTDVSPMIGMSYAFTPSINGYAKVAQGFKSGGWNLDYVTGPLPDESTLDFDAESATTYEIGLKNRLFDSRVVLNVAAFQTKYDDLQVNQRVFEPSSGLTLNLVTNAGKATINGLEVEGLAQLSESLTFSASVGYADATFDSYKDAGGIGIHFDGHQLEYAPKLDGSASIQYEQPISTYGTALFSLDYYYKDDFFTNVANDPGLAIEGLSLLSGRLGFRSSSEKFQVFLWAENLTDELAVVNKNFLGDILQVRYTEPRTYGLQLNYLLW